MKPIEFSDLPEDVQEALDMIHIPGVDVSESITTLRSISDKYPGFVPARLNLAAMQLDSGDPTSAEETYRAVLADFPDASGAVAGLATVHAARNEYERAEQLAREAIEAGYEWSPLYQVIAEAREHAGDIPAASDALLKCYRLSPHSWNALESYCRLNDRPFYSPMDEVPQPISDENVKTLIEYIDDAAHTPDQDGELPGCDHTFRFTEQWANTTGVEIIDLYQFLNAHGGFCDCEVCFNVESSLFEDDLDFDDDDDDSDNDQ